MAGEDMDVDDLIAGLGDSDDDDDDSDLGLPDDNDNDASQEAAADGTGPGPTGRAWEDWGEYFDPGSQNYYYHNAVTGEVQWEAPAGSPPDIFAFPQAESPQAESPQAASEFVAEVADPGPVDAAPQVQVSRADDVADVLADLGSDDSDTETEDDDDGGLMGVFSSSPRFQGGDTAPATASTDETSSVEVAVQRRETVQQPLAPDQAVAIHSQAAVLHSQAASYIQATREEAAKHEEPPMEASPAIEPSPAMNLPPTRSPQADEPSTKREEPAIEASPAVEASPQPAIVQEVVAVPQNAAMGIALKNSQSAVPAFAQEVAPKQAVAPKQEIVEQPIISSEAAVASSRSSRSALHGQAVQAASITLFDAVDDGKTISESTSKPPREEHIEQPPREVTLSFRDAGLSSLSTVQLDVHPPLLSLCLAGNNFADHTELASHLSRLEALTNLDISRCRLKQLPLLVHCRSLEVFNASDNFAISSRGLLYCTSLRRVLLRRNRLRHIEQMETLNKMEELDVSHNQLGPTPGAALRALGGCAALRVLNVAGNPFAKADHRSQVRNFVPSLVMIDGHPVQRRLPPPSAATPVRSSRSGAKVSRPATEPRNAVARVGARAKRPEPAAAVAREPAEARVAAVESREPTAAEVRPQVADSTNVSSFSPPKPAPTELSELALHAAAMQREFALMFSRQRPPEPPEPPASYVVDASLLSSIIAESPDPSRHPPLEPGPLMSPSPERQQFQPQAPVVFCPSPEGIAPAALRASTPPQSNSLSTLRVRSPSPLDSSLLPLGLSSLGSPLRCSEPSGPKSPCRTGGRRIGATPATSVAFASEEKPLTDAPMRSSITPASPAVSAYMSPLPPAFHSSQAAAYAVHTDVRRFKAEDQFDRHLKLLERVAPRSLNLAEPARSPSPSPLPGAEGDLKALRESLRDFIGHKRALAEQYRSS